MSATNNLDKGLDEIIAGSGISSGGRKQRTTSRGFKKARSGASTKTLGKAVAAAAAVSGKKEQQRGKKTKRQNQGSSVAQALSAGAPVALPGVNPLASAKRVVVSNLPLDITEQAVREYFSNAVGKIREVVGSFRGDGTPSGTYTITFDKQGAAQKMAEKFHNQPIDGGKTHLAVQILLDPTIAPPTNPLKGRIGVASVANNTAAAAAGPAAAASGSQKKRNNKNRRSGKSDAKPAKVVEDSVRKDNNNNKSKGSKSKKPQRKVRSAADLDAEMSDYFANAEKNEISV